MNTCHNALDRHVDGVRAEQPALIYDSPVTESIASFTYREFATQSRSSPARSVRRASRPATG